MVPSRPNSSLSSGREPDQPRPDVSVDGFGADILTLHEAVRKGEYRFFRSRITGYRGIPEFWRGNTRTNRHDVRFGSIVLKKSQVQGRRKSS